MKQCEQRYDDGTVHHGNTKEPERLYITTARALYRDKCLVLIRRAFEKMLCRARW